MPFDSAEQSDDGDPAAALRAWIAIRVSFCEAAVANGADHHRREARFLVALIDHQVLEFEMIWDEPPDLGLLGERLDLLRAQLFD